MVFSGAWRSRKAMEPELLDWVELRLRRERELINEAMTTQHLQLMAELRTRRCSEIRRLIRIL